MPLRVYSTLTKTKDEFRPVRPGHVGIYLCGPTVYKPSHIGHMVGPVIFDCIKRYLRYSGYQVTLVINITDVDDKLIVRSRELGVSMRQLAEEMTADYLANLQAMGVDTIDHFPKATDNIGEICALISSLIEKGFAYESQGDVFFDVGRDAEYGKLSGRSVNESQGEGGEAASRKRSVADFTLWKRAKPGEPQWDSPWGPGRPGWHIECSAMSRRYLGETFDIHGGGLDLIFPHHENEVAQSECCHGRPQANYWLHNGLMQAADELGKVGGRATRAAEAGDKEAQEVGKISKSKGAAPFHELLAEFSPETIRFLLVSTHYRSPIYFSPEALRNTATALDKFYQFFRRFERVTGASFYRLPQPERREQGVFEPGESPMLREVHALRERFLANMDDDFNTGGAMGDLFELVRLLNRHVETEKLESAGKAQTQAVSELRQGAIVLRELAGVLGLFRQPVEPRGGAGQNALLGPLLELLIEIRAEARAAKNFAVADKVRKRLAELGVTLEDRAEKTEWTLAR